MSIESNAAKRLNILAKAACESGAFNEEAFKRAYNESRNGSNSLTELTIKFSDDTLPLKGKFLISDGVKECLDAGAKFFIAGMAMELQLLVLQLTPEQREYWSCLVMVVAEEGKGRIEFQFDDGIAALCAEIERSEFPDGTWSFYISNDGEPDLAICILITEY